MTKLLDQISEEINLKFVARRETSVTSLASERIITFAVPICSCFSQPRACRNHSDVAYGVRGPVIQHSEVFIIKRQHPIGICQKIIDKPCVLDPQLPGDVSLLNHPCQIRRFDSPMLHGSCNPEAGI